MIDLSGTDLREADLCEDCFFFRLKIWPPKVFRALRCADPLTCANRTHTIRNKNDNN
jgi:hypothetical protein